MQAACVVFLHGKAHPRTPFLLPENQTARGLAPSRFPCVWTLGARAKITSHFGIPSPGHLWPILNRKILEIVLLLLRSCSTGSTKPDPDLGANSAKLFLRGPLTRIIHEPARVLVCSLLRKGISLSRPYPIRASFEKSPCEPNTCAIIAAVHESSGLAATPGLVCSCHVKPPPEWAGQVIYLYPVHLGEQVAIHDQAEPSFVIDLVSIRRLVQSQAPGGAASPDARRVDPNRWVSVPVFERFEELTPRAVRNLDHDYLPCRGIDLGSRLR